MHSQTLPGPSPAARRGVGWRGGIAGELTTRRAASPSGAAVRTGPGQGGKARRDLRPRRPRMCSEASGSWQDQDVFSGPAVERALRIAAAVPAGMLVRTAFSAYDTGDLIDLEGASFIVKLPESVPPNPR